ncbi:MAG: alpha/beta hydrolase [Gemmatimonadota bacterium]|nr:alpha/beta hydrolase [Gemmatimonadota bacterium]
MILRWLAAAVAVYLVYAAILFLLQRTMMYPGTRLAPGPSSLGADGAAVGVEEVALESEAGAIRAWYAPAAQTAPAGPGPGAILFHGNAELADDLIPAFRPLAELGVSALFVEYPGFGGEPGRPTETTIMAVAETAYDWLAGRNEVDAKLVIALGRSLGTGPAAALTLRRPIAALVLWAPFVSVGHLALRSYGVPPFLARDRFDTRAALREYDGAVILFHGRRDGVIPFSNSEILADAHPEARLVEWSCGHNDCPPRPDALWGPLSAFLEEAGLVDRGTFD